MKVLMLLLMVGLTLVLIFVGSNDAARYKEDQEKYGGDQLIKAISEYNEKSSNLRGPVGSVGVTRTPLTEGYDQRNRNNFGSNSRRRGTSSERWLPDYMQGTPPEARQGYYPPNPYAPQGKQRLNSGTYNSNSGNSNSGSAQDDSYYPPAPIEDDSSDDQNYPPQSRNKHNVPFVVPMTLPDQPWPQEALRLRSGQQIGFAGTTVYTYDKAGNPIPLPDGKYQVGGVVMYVKDSKQVLVE